MRTMMQLDELHGLFGASTDEEWAETLFSIARKCGFDHALFGIVPNKQVALETAFLKSNYPDEWRTLYDNQHMHYVDPTVSHCLQSMLPIVWQPATFQGREQNEFYEQARGYGLKSGISLPVHGAAGEFGVLSFVSDGAQHLATDNKIEGLATLSLIRDYALESSRRFLAPEAQAAPTVRLTARELECLQWAMCGKSSWEIARILSRSEATINFHVANAKKKFNVQTRQQAVVKAIKMGLIEPA